MVMKALISSETSVLTRATQRNIPVDAILHSHRRENLKSYLLPFVYLRISRDKAVGVAKGYGMDGKN
jgi:hypothetical protein